MSRSNDQILLNRIIADDQDACKDVYIQNKVVFTKTCHKKFEINQKDAEELYHEAVIIFFQNARNGKLIEMRSTILTYLLGTAHNLLFRKKTYNDRFLLTRFASEWSEALKDTDEEREYLIMVERAIEVFDQTGEPCRSILEKFYFEKWNLDKLTKHFEYKNKDTMKSKKSKCLKLFREEIIKKLNIKTL